MVFIILERVIWNGSGESVSVSEKLAWNLGKKALCCPPSKVLCAYLERKGKAYTDIILVRFSKKPVHCTP